MGNFTENIKYKSKRFVKSSITKYYLNKISKENYFTKEQIEELKLKKWLKISRYAVKKIPFYIDLSKQLGFSAKDINSIDDLTLFPFISKSDLFDNIELFLPRGINKSKLIINSSSGTTGQPLEIYESKTNRMLERAYILDQWKRVGFIPNKSKVLAIRGRDSTNQKKNNHLFNYSIQQLNQNYIDEIIEVIKNHDVKFIHTYPSSLKILLSYIEQNEIYTNVFKGINAVLLSSENVDADLTKTLSEKYNVHFFYHYGHTEHLIMAAICGYSTDYHIYPSYGYCEIIDSDETVINENGIMGEIVGTSFNNFVMPLIRYKTGDYAEFSTDVCRCNRKWQKIKNLTGKYEFYKVYDKDMNVSNFSHHYRIAVHIIGENPYLNILKYQYTQNVPGILELKYIPDSSFTKRDINNLDKLFLSFYKNKMKLITQKVDEIESDLSGKLKPLIQKIKVEK